MAAHAARRLLRMNANLNVILGVELLCAAQGIGFRAPLKTSAALQGIIKALRETVPEVREDRYMAPDIARAAALIADGVLLWGLDLPGHAQGAGR
jgi:histidine ammonia-lyase